MLFTDAHIVNVCSPFLPGRQAWDLAVDICLSQLPDVIENPGSFKVFGAHMNCDFA